MSAWHILFTENFHKELSLSVRFQPFASGLCLGEKIGNFTQLNRLFMVSPERKVNKELLSTAASFFGNELVGFFFFQKKIPFFPILENRLALNVFSEECFVYHCRLYPEKKLTLLKKIKLQEEK